MSSDKASLRTELKNARLSLNQEQRELKSVAICKNLETATDWKAIKSLHYFEPIDSLSEVNIRNFIAWVKTDYPEISLYTSRQVNDSWQVVALADNQPAQAHDLGAVLVPMLGFDNNLQRIGYGGGYYDKLLATQPKARKIGVCFGLGKIDNVPVEPHDVPLDIIATEAAVIKSA
jgi:5-formyltetrahydrofolate cyclo-ligase